MKDLLSRMPDDQGEIAHVWNAEGLLQIDVLHQAIGRDRIETAEIIIEKGGLRCEEPPSGACRQDDAEKDP